MPYYIDPLAHLKTFKFMNTIIQQFKEHYPEIFPEISIKERCVPYSVLQHFGAYCAQNLEQEKSREILHTINNVYQQKKLFICNAIENEFLAEIANRLGVNNLMWQLQNMPENLWPEYLKVLIETQKNKHQ